MVDYSRTFIMPDSSLSAEADGDGDVELWVNDGGYYSESVLLTIQDLECMLSEAKRHKAAYDAYKEADYDDDTYTNVYESLAR